MKKEPIKRYSQAFKQQVVREYEAGASVYSLLNKYGIAGYHTVKRWVKQYGRSAYRAEVVVIETVEDQWERRAMKQRITELEAALAQSTLDNQMLNAILEVASQSLTMDLKKNFGRRSSHTS